MEASVLLTANIDTQENSHFFVLILFFSSVRVHSVDISSIDEQHITTKGEDDDEEEEGEEEKVVVRL